MQNGGKCQISDICPRSAPCISGPVSSMLEEMRKGAEEDAGRVSRHAVQPDGPQGGPPGPPIRGFCRHRIDLLRLFEGEIALAGSSQNGFVLRKHAVSTALLDHVSHELRQEQD